MLYIFFDIITVIFSTFSSGGEGRFEPSFLAADAILAISLRKDALSTRWGAGGMTGIVWVGAGIAGSFERDEAGYV